MGRRGRFGGLADPRRWESLEKEEPTGRGIPLPGVGNGQEARLGDHGGLHGARKHPVHFGRRQALGSPEHPGGPLDVGDLLREIVLTENAFAAMFSSGPHCLVWVRRALRFQGMAEPCFRDRREARRKARTRRNRPDGSPYNFKIVPCSTTRHRTQGQGIARSFTGPALPPLCQ